MAGRTVIVTGATGGIGLAACQKWARQGEQLVMVGRDAAKLNAAIKTLPDPHDMAHLGLLADMASQEQVRVLAEELLERCSRIDVLFLNAGAFHGKFEMTEDGIERTFAVNHLAPFLLTENLMSRLVESAPMRVIVTSSRAHRYGGRFDPEEWAHPKRYVAYRAYGASKLANILFAQELAHRLEGTGVTAYSFHPGVVATGFAQGQGLAGYAFNLIRPFLRSPEDAARTALYLAESLEVVTKSGGYFADSRLASVSRLALDRDAARRLWETSRQLCGLV